MTREHFIRICRALASAAALEEKARENPSQAAKLTELARKLRVGAAMLEGQGAQGESLSDRQADEERTPTDVGAVMRDEGMEMVDYLSRRVSALEEAQRRRAMFWETFWVLALLLIGGVGPLITGALVLWGPWVVAAIVVSGFAIWRIVAWLIERGGTEKG